MQKKIKKIVIAILLYLGTCILASVFIQPFSILSFIGPAAALTGALIITWGTYLLISVILSSLIFNFVLTVYFDVSIDIAIYMISILAICLQGAWVKRIGYMHVAKQRWLGSRRHTVLFIFKIGPLASIVCASAAVLVAMLDVKQIDSSLIYVFITTWSASILVSIFVTPLLLFSIGQQKFNLTKRISIAVLSSLGFVVIGLLLKIAQQQYQEQRLEHFSQVHVAIESYINDEIEQISKQITALSAFFEASDKINIKEFNEFTSRIYIRSSHVSALQWIPVVSDANRQLFEEHTTSSLGLDYVINEQTVMGNIIQAQNKPIFMPVQYIYPRYKNEAAFGLDLSSIPELKKAMNLAASTRTAVASAPLTLVQDDFSETGLMVLLPISNTKMTPQYGSLVIKNQSEFSGFIAAVLQFKPIFRKIENMQTDKNINVYIEDIDDEFFSPLYGSYLAKTNRLTSTMDIKFFSRIWRFDLTESDAWVVQGKNWKLWIVLFSGTLGGLLYQLFILIMATYNTELSDRVRYKSRELILAKVQSDLENQAKTDYLHSLGAELRNPLNVIKRLIEVFPEKKLPEKAVEYLSGIADATLNLEQLVDTVTELSNTKSGKQSFKIQSFDFMSFLNRMEGMLKVSSLAQGNYIKLIVNSDVPQFIDTDELRLQQMFTVLAENVTHILLCNSLCIHVKVRFHKKNNATIIFVVTSLESHKSFEGVTPEIKNKEQGKTTVNARIAMIKELCYMFNGDIKISEIPSGSMILSVSIKVLLSNIKQEDFGRYTTLRMKKMLSTDTKRILFVENIISNSDELCQQLLSLDYQIEVIDSREAVSHYLDNDIYHMVIYDCGDMESNYSLINNNIQQHKKYYSIPLIGIFDHELDEKQVLKVKEGLNAFIVRPIKIDLLKNVLAEYLH